MFQSDFLTSHRDIIIYLPGQYAFLSTGRTEIYLIFSLPIKKVFLYRKKNTGQGIRIYKRKIIYLKLQ